MIFTLKTHAIEWAYFITTYLCFLSFWHSSLFVFKKTKGGYRNNRLFIKGLSLALWNLFPFLFFFSPTKLSVPYLKISITMSSTALLVYWISVHSIKNKEFSVIASTDSKPSQLHHHGIYRFIRHPFYSSYILCYLGICIHYFFNPITIIALALIFIYILEARSEELFFLSGPLNNKYNAYKKNTGAFLPKVSFKA